MWNPFKKSKLQILSPLNGDIVPLEEVPDPVFSQKMMGEGVAIVPTDGDVCAPINGTIKLIAETKHAVGIRAEDGTEILIHIGLETVSLKGEGFEVKVKLDEQVSVGQPLLAVDWDYIRTHAKSTITPIVITKSNDKQFTMTDEVHGIAGTTVLMTAK